MGAHLLAIKDMAGLCKPYAAELLVRTLKQEIGIPVHFHTHDTSGVQAGAIIKAAEAGLDIADAAMAPHVGPDLAAELEQCRRSAALHSARHDGSSSRTCKRLPAIGRRHASFTRRSKRA